jgi:hypothetical protein
MTQDLQDTVVADAKQSVRKLLEAAIIFPDHKEDMIGMAMETIELTILNSFWKHGIPCSVKNNKEEDIKQ